MLQVFFLLCIANPSADVDLQTRPFADTTLFGSKPTLHILLVREAGADCIVLLSGTVAHLSRLLFQKSLLCDVDQVYLPVLRVR